MLIIVDLYLAYRVEFYIKLLQKTELYIKLLNIGAV